MTAARGLADLGNQQALTVDANNSRVGVGSTVPSSSFNVGEAIVLDSTSGIVTATAGSFSGTITGVDVNVSGSATVDGQLSVGGTITYEDVTNVDSVGIITAGLGLRITGGGIQAVGVYTGLLASGIATVADGIRVDNGGLQVVGVYTGLKASGVSTFAGGDILIDGSAVGVTSVTWDASADSLILKDKSYLKFGDGSDMSVYHDGSNAMIDNNTGNLNIQTGGTLYLTNASGGEVYAQFSENGASQLRYDNSTKFETTAIGVQLTDTALIKNTTGISTLTLGKGAALADGCCQIQTVNTGADTDQLGLDFLVHASTFGTVAPVSALKIWHDSSFVFDNGSLIEKCKIDTDALNSDQVCSLDDGMVHYRTSNLGGSGGTSLILTSTVGLNTAMATGDTLAFTLIHATNTTGNYVDHINIDYVPVTENWVGGSAPTDGGSSGVDIYTFNIIKTGDAAWTTIANQIKTS